MRLKISTFGFLKSDTLDIINTVAALEWLDALESSRAT